MRDAMEKRRDLREKLSSDRLVVAPGAHNALVAKLIENWYEFSGIGAVRTLEEKYLPSGVVERKYAGGKGYLPASDENR